MFSSVVKVTQSRVDEVEDVQYPVEEDQKALLTAFGSNRSFPVVTIPGSVLTQQAQSGELGQLQYITSILLHTDSHTYIDVKYC